MKAEAYTICVQNTTGLEEPERRGVVSITPIRIEWNRWNGFMFDVFDIEWGKIDGKLFGISFGYKSFC